MKAGRLPIGAAAAACAGLWLGASASAVPFTVTSFSGTTDETDPALESFLLGGGAGPVPVNFDLDPISENPSSMFTFPSVFIFTDEVSAAEPDDERTAMPNASITVNLGGPGGTTGTAVVPGFHFGQSLGVFSLPVGGTVEPFGAVIEFDTPQIVQLGIYTLQVEGIDTVYNEGGELLGIPFGLTADSSGPDNGANVPIKITLIEVIPEPTTAALLGLAGLACLARRRVA